MAAVLNLPLGTVKTRIRVGMQKLRFLLAPLGVAVLAIALLAGAVARITVQRIARQRTDRAMSMVTASDITTLHLAAAPGVASETHGSYRGRAGTPLAVLALHNVKTAPAGTTYQAWVMIEGTWTSIGTVTPDADGNAVLVAEGKAFAALPKIVEVTVEPSGGSAAPTGPVLIIHQGD